MPIPIDYDYYTDDISFPLTLLVGGDIGTTDTVAVRVVTGHPVVNLTGWGFKNWTPDAPDHDLVIIDGSGLNESLDLTGSSQNDWIIGSDADDVIRGFVRADKIDGGGGIDTLLLTGTSLDLNVADDCDLEDVEIISALMAEYGVVIDLGKQSDGFKIIGSRKADTIKGSTGDDKIVGFTLGDKVDGGDGADTLVLSKTSYALNSAADKNLKNVETISASDAQYGVVIDLGKQRDGFEIIGSSKADRITGSKGNDTIVGFTWGDKVDGGLGTDTLVLSKTSYALNNAADWKLKNVEIVSASEAECGVIIDLSNQDEGFKIVGSAKDDTITGGGGADVIEAGDGDDTIVGFTWGDKVDGGEGTDTLVLSKTSYALNNAADKNLKNVETISASDAQYGVVIDLGKQRDGFEIIGSSKADRIEGSKGDDTIVGFTWGDRVDGGAGTDTLVLSKTSYALNNVADWKLKNVEIVSASEAECGVVIDLSKQDEGFKIVGSAKGDTITGGGGADVIEAGDGDDTIVGFTLGDSVDGGCGEDTLVLAATSEGLNAAEDCDLVGVEIVSAADAACGVEIDLGKQDEGFRIVGSAKGDTITGGGGADVIDAGDGDDTIIGFVGGDKVDGGTGTDTLVLSETSNALNQAANDELDRVEIVSASSAATGVEIDLSKQVEGFRIVGSAKADTITGGGGADVIEAGDGDDTIVGFTLGDSVDGGTGTDTLVLRGTSNALNQATNDKLDKVEIVSAAGAAFGVEIDLRKQVEGFRIVGSAKGDTITGGGGADVIDAGDGDDTIIGFTAGDKVDGGAGTDTLVLRGTSNALNQAANDKLDKVEIVSAATAAAGVNLNLSKQSEGFNIVGSTKGDIIAGSTGIDVIAAGGGNDSIAGNAGNDVVNGGSGNDLIRGSLADGNDVYDGGSGNDTVDYSAVSGGVRVDLVAENRSGQAIPGVPGTFGALLLAGGYAAGTPVGMATGASIGADALISIENVVGSQGNDTVFGNDIANFLDGRGGNDKIWGRGGNDTIRGGDGNDVLVGGFGGSGGKSSGNDALFGEAGNDELYGEDGDDVLVGGAGSDQYAGGNGADLLIFDGDGAGDTAWGGTGRDTFRFERGFGVDRIKDFLATGRDSDKIDLSAFGGLTFKKLKIKQTGSDVEITSSAFGKGNKIILEVVNAGALSAEDFGFSGYNRIKGTKKNDKLNGTAHNDRIDGLRGKDKLKGKDGNDLLNGGAGKDRLEGGAGNDILKGGGGADTLIGGPGADTLTGGGGKDTFVFAFASDGRDTITDFVSRTDKLQVSASGFGGGLVAGGGVTLVKLADINGYVHSGSKGVFLLDNAGAGSGTLYWDASGGSSVDAVALARLNTSVLFASDFLVA